MAKFLHEYLHFGNGKVQDNGWWEICGSKLYNRAGGRHDYVPQEDDEIREGTWNDIIKETVVDNTQITGWIAPNGTFYGCSPLNHAVVAEYVLNSSEKGLEEQGYVKIFENPAFLRREYPEYPRYEYMRGDSHYPNSAQIHVLREKGLVIKERHLQEQTC